MQATAETVNFQADALLNENVPVLSRPFDYRDVGAQVTPPVIELHPYQGPAHEGSSNAPTAMLASKSNLETYCAKTIFADPTVLDASLNKPGQAGQNISINLEFAPVDPKCNGHYVRKAYLKPQIQDIKHRNRWINYTGDRVDYLYGVGNGDDTGGVLLRNTYRKEKLYYKPGSGVQVRYQLGIEERNKKTGDVVDTKVIPNNPIHVN